MKTVTPDASKWRTPSDFYDAILEAPGSPEWHGQNLNALTESMVWGEINAVEPPHTMRIISTANCPSALREELTLVAKTLAKTRSDFKSIEGHDVEVNFALIP